MNRSFAEASLDRTQRVICGMSATVILVLLTIPLIMLRSLNKLRPKPEPGYAGDWRGHLGRQVEERPLPRGDEIWKDWEQWNSDTHVGTTRVYWAKIGGRKRQKDFKIEHLKTWNMPLGDYTCTFASFRYLDPQRGDWILTWSRPGRHNPPGLRPNHRERMILLQPHGSADANAVLSILAMEGVKPRHPAHP